MSVGQSAHRRTQRVPLSASRARLPAARRSCGQPGAMQPAGPSATQRRGAAAVARGMARRPGSAAAPANPTAAAPAPFSSWRRLSINGR
jgi:hypothetical protein